MSSKFESLFKAFQLGISKSIELQPPKVAGCKSKSKQICLNFELKFKLKDTFKLKVRNKR